jgi:hypothetical protein
MTRNGQKHPESRRQDAFPICFHSFSPEGGKGSDGHENREGFG